MGRWVVWAVAALAVLAQVNDAADFDAADFEDDTVALESAERYSDMYDQSASPVLAMEEDDDEAAEIQDSPADFEKTSSDEEGDDGAEVATGTLRPCPT